MNEQHKHPQKPINLPIIFVDANGTRQTSNFKNLNLGNNFIITADPPPYETKLELEVHFADFDEQNRITTTMRWTQHNGINVQFDMMKTHETHALLNLLKQN